MTNPTCKMCGAPVTVFVKSTNSWRLWCSNKCMGHDPEVLARKAATNMQRFGVEHPMKLTETRDKIKQTNMDRHGYENPFCEKVVQDQIKKTNLAKYGVENPAKSSKIREKISKAKLADYADNKKEIIDKRRATNFKQWGVVTNKHLHIPLTSISLMKDLEWVCDQHFNLKKSCQQIGDELGVAANTILTFLHDNNIKVTRFPVSRVEQEVRDYVATLTTELVVHNDRTILFPKEIDTWIPGKRLAIEVNGIFWHSEHHGKNCNYHVNKTQNCEDQNIQLIQLYDSEWNDPIHQLIIKSTLSQLLGISTSISSRKCDVKSVTITQANSFLNNNHLQGACDSLYNLGLWYNDQLVALASFGNSQINKNYELELLRYCEICDHSIADSGLNKLMNHLSKYINNTAVVLYADRRMTANLNNVYSAAGFVCSKITAPRYKYFKIVAGKTPFLDPSKYQEDRLSKFLAKFDPALSEYENMYANKYDRIWDCGNLEYVWNNKTQFKE